MPNNIVAKAEAAIRGQQNASKRAMHEVEESKKFLEQFGEKEVGGPSKHLLLAQEVTRKLSPSTSPSPTPKQTPSPSSSPPQTPRARLSLGASAAAPVIGAVGHGGRTRHRRRYKSRLNRRTRRAKKQN
jgi:hypothetical protein